MPVAAKCGDFLNLSLFAVIFLSMLNINLSIKGSNESVSMSCIDFVNPAEAKAFFERFRLCSPYWIQYVLYSHLLFYQLKHSNSPSYHSVHRFAQAFIKTAYVGFLIQLFSEFFQIFSGHRFYNSLTLRNGSACK